jgi:glycosyltransferase involved in cell wall biosynthesis
MACHATADAVCLPFEVCGRSFRPKEFLNMAVFAFCQHRLGRTDGVSLEVDKWRRILEAMGHTVHYIAGNDDVPGGHAVAELYPFHPVMSRLIRNATRALTDYPSGPAFMQAVNEHAAIIRPRLEAFIRDLHVDVMVPNNILSVGYNLPGMKALYDILDATGIPAICHSHDFWWEDSGEVNPTCDEVLRFYLKHAPPALPNVKHVVINRLAQTQLRQRRGLDATVVPNVFDFDQPPWREDDYNRDFRAAIGLSPTDLYFLQATRILDRKAVELAIDVVAELGKPENRAQLQNGPLYDGRPFTPGDRIVLVCAGYVEGIGLSARYHEGLVDKAREKGVDILWVADRVKHSREHAGGRKIYSLWDSYVHADFVTYPSTWEGWGNQFIEALFARLPVVLFEYPVYVSDLRQHGFDVVSLGDTVGPKDARGLVTLPPARLERAAQGIIRYLKDPDARRRAVEHNVAVAADAFSMQALESIVCSLLSGIGIPTEVP